MGPLILAWLAGESMIIYRWVRAGAPPTPGALALGSGLFVLTAVLAEYRPARTVATLLAVGVDVAAYLQVVGGKPVSQATGWPPLMINDPTVLLPAGSNGQGQILPEGTGTSAGQQPAGQNALQPQPGKLAPAPGSLGQHGIVERPG